MPNLKKLMEATKTMLYAAKAKSQTDEIIKKTIENQYKITEINGKLTEVNGNHWKSFKIISNQFWFKKYLLFRNVQL